MSVCVCNCVLWNYAYDYNENKDSKTLLIINKIYITHRQCYKILIVI